ncbi:XAC2610-related protein [Pseudomonas lopnurensis]|uniref:XAC2610-related protein n=1 Tax=Pseudomonas lopnurensis TaxID=1477517 RepID=UPI0028B1D61B|nr:hypothetical protein [Pseudomonas lopnurensis]
MTLVNDGEKINGEYFYRKYKIPISLQGSIIDSTLSLTESTDRGKAYIKANISGNKIEGEWKNKNKSYEIHAQALSNSYKDLVTDIIIGGTETNRELKVIFKNGIIQDLSFDSLTSRPLIIFEDFTFDGQPDMRILELETSGNSSFSYFEYNSERKRFIGASPEISNLVSPRILHHEKTILSISRDGCCLYQAQKIQPNEYRLAEYDYDSKSGHEQIENLETKEKSSKPINKDYFEQNYLKLIGIGANDKKQP